MMPYPHYQAGILAESPLDFSAYRPSRLIYLTRTRAIRPADKYSENLTRASAIHCRALLKQLLTDIPDNYLSDSSNNFVAYIYIRPLFIKKLSSISSIMRGQINF